jgi:hypothetical protein
MHAPAVRSRRALVTPARTTLAGDARRHQGGFDQGVWAGVDRWWLAPHGLRFVVPAQDNMAVTVDAQAHAAAGEGGPLGRRAHTGRQGQGRTAGIERLEPAVVGIAGLTTDDPEGTPEHGRHHHRRDFHSTRLHAVVVGTWHGQACGPAGQPGFLTNATGDKPLPPCDDDDDRRRIEPGWIKARKPPWRLTPPPQKTARAVRVHVRFTLRMFALATAYRWHGAPEAPGGEPGGWQRWRRQLWEPTRDHVSVVAHGCDGLLHLAEDSWLLGVNRKDRPPGIGTHPQILAQDGLPAQRCASIGISECSFRRGGISYPANHPFLRTSMSTG